MPNRSDILGLIESTVVVYIGNAKRYTAGSHKWTDLWDPTAYVSVIYGYENIISEEGYLKFQGSIPNRHKSYMKRGLFGYYEDNSKVSSDTNHKDRWKPLRKPIGGQNLENLSPNHTSNYCVHCMIWIVEFSDNIDTMGNIASGAGPIGTILDMVPGAETAENVVALVGDALSIVSGELVESKTMRVRMTICADGSVQIATFNVPGVRVVGAGAQGIYIKTGSWIHSNLGNTGLIETSRSFMSEYNIWDD